MSLKKECNFFLNALTQIRLIKSIGYIHYSNKKYAQKIAPVREKVLALQKPVQISKKISRILVSDKFWEKSRNHDFIKSGWVTKKL